MIKYCSVQSIASDGIVFRSRVDVNVYTEITAVTVSFSDPSVLPRTLS